MKFSFSLSLSRILSSNCSTKLLGLENKTLQNCIHGVNKKRKNFSTIFPHFLLHFCLQFFFFYILANVNLLQQKLFMSQVLASDLNFFILQFIHFGVSFSIGRLKIINNKKRTCNLLSLSFIFINVEFIKLNLNTKNIESRTQIETVKTAILCFHNGFI